MRRNPFPAAILIGILGEGPLGTGVSEAGVLRVPQDHARITDALASAGAGDVVLVAAGTYAPSHNGEAFPLGVPCGVTLAGAGMDACTLDAEGQGSVIHMIGPSARVTGFTITGGRTTEGGGIRVFPVGSSEIDHNLIRENRSLAVGSGIHVDPGGASWIHHNVLWANADLDTAGPGDPHGIELINAVGLVERNVIGLGDSNGLITNSNATVIRDNIFFENGIPGVRGRGICTASGARPVIAHNLFFGNRVAALLVAPGVGNVTGEEANELSEADGIYGNLDADPLFLDAEGGDWHLSASSPGIDAGDPASPLDPDGTRADIGAFYFLQSTTDLPDIGVTHLVLTASPNPSSGPTLFQYTTHRPEPVELAVYDLQGRRVVLLVAREEEPGSHQVPWDGTSQSGDRITPGVYFARLRVGTVEAHGKVLIVP